MLTGILVPTSGELHVGGLVPHRQRIENARRIGVVFGQRTQLWWDLTVIDSLALQARVYGVPERRFRDNLAHFDELLGLSSFWHQTARRVSLGQRMRADLAMALLHDPAIAYLDEPTIGLDLTAKEQIRGFLSELNRERGTTIVLTTHDLLDVEAICRRVVIIDRGRKLFDGTLADMKDRFARTRTIRFHLETVLPEAASASLSALPGIELSTDGDHRMSLVFDRFRHSAGELTRRLMHDAAVRDFQLEEPSIEDVIRQVYSGTILRPETA